MSEIIRILATFTQQVISRPQEGNAQRPSSSRTQERIDRHSGLVISSEAISTLHFFFEKKMAGNLR